MPDVGPMLKKKRRRRRKEVKVVVKVVEYVEKDKVGGKTFMELEVKVAGIKTSGGMAV